MIQVCPHCGERIAKPKRKRIAQRIPGTSRAEAREAKRQRHREETAAIREAVFKRAEWRCQWTLPSGRRCSRLADHLHHKEGGSGRRRQRQSVENTEALCWFHHKEAHGELAASSPRGDARERKEGTT